MTRPRYKRMYDHLTYPSRNSTLAERTIDHAIAPFDRASREIEAKWGTDRLVTLVSPATAARYGKTLASLNAAIDAQDIDRAVDRAEACIRGMAVMDAEAVAAGHVPPVSGVIVADVDDFTFGVLPNDRLWQMASREYPGLRIVNLREIALLVQAADRNNPLLAAVKDEFPGAAIDAIRERRTPMREDPVPTFGIEDDEIPY